MDWNANLLFEIEAGGCEEHGRVTRAYVSGYKRARIHNSELYPRERRCLVANVNGAIAPGEAIKRVVWRMETVTAVAMSSPSIEGREARVLVEACYRGEAFIQCEIQLGNGEVYPQTFRIRVLDGPFFGNENTSTGPQMLAIDA
ncbi:hypothetical protein ACI2IY_05700 [Lysobacter enzymogenes]|uniref:hypothetical protein n=1 Tax=Lysobacter enzymogenes TaxID=69 RepID=UPI00384D2DE4